MSNRAEERQTVGGMAGRDRITGVAKCCWNRPKTGLAAPTAFQTRGSQETPNEYFNRELNPGPFAGLMMKNMRPFAASRAQRKEFCAVA